jgi:sulfur-carrier protein
MKITLRFFASLREALGASAQRELSEPCTVAQLRDELIAQGAPHAAALARGRAVRCALNQTLCDESALLSDGDEVAFFPPVTGG